MNKEEAVKIMKEEYELHYNLPKDMTTNGYQRIRQAFKILISEIENNRNVLKQEEINK